MSYHVSFTKEVIKEIKKLDKYTQRMVTSWIRKNLEGIDDPRRIGKALTGNKRGYWRYRIGDYRLICTIEDEKVVIIALNIGHRREIYK